jgi:SpoVK/Ycf46/Vps4 family AAA+-type ATPase
VQVPLPDEAARFSILKVKFKDLADDLGVREGSAAAAAARGDTALAKNCCISFPRVWFADEYKTTIAPSVESASLEHRLMKARLMAKVCRLPVHDLNNNHVHDDGAVGSRLASSPPLSPQR